MLGFRIGQLLKTESSELLRFLWVHEVLRTVFAFAMVAPRMHHGLSWFSVSWKSEWLRQSTTATFMIQRAARWLQLIKNVATIRDALHPAPPFFSVSRASSLWRCDGAIVHLRGAALQKMTNNKLPTKDKIHSAERMGEPLAEFSSNASKIVQVWSLQQKSGIPKQLWKKCVQVCSSSGLKKSIDA